MTEHEWLNSNDPQALLGFLSLRRGGINECKLRAVAATCCRLAAQNVTWGWSPEAEEVLQTIERYASSDCGAESLVNARQAAEKLSQQAFAHHDMMTRHVADPSDYVWAMDALFEASSNDAFKAAVGAAMCAVSSVVGCPLCCEFNGADLDRQNQAKRRIADIIRDSIHPFGPDKGTRLEFDTGVRRGFGG